MKELFFDQVYSLLGILQNNYSEKFWKICRKTPAMESIAFMEMQKLIRRLVFQRKSKCMYWRLLDAMNLTYEEKITEQCEVICHLEIYFLKIEGNTY